MAEARPYYSDKGLSAAFYDLITAHDQTLAGDVDLYASLAPAGGTILELGAGTGRVAIALAERGFSITGVDLAPAMLEQAQAKRAQLPADVAARLEFRRGDMGALDLKRTFDAVISPFFTLAHLPAGAAWRNAFSTIARHLPPGGLAAVHLPLASLMAQAGAFDPKRAVMELDAGAGKRLVLYVKDRRFREALGRFDQVLEYVVVDSGGRPVRRSQERLTYYAADPTPFAEGAGLARDRDPVLLGGVGEIHVFRKP